MKLALRNFLRSRKVTLTASATVLALVFFLMTFSNTIGINQAELKKAYETLEVKAHIEGASSTKLPTLSVDRFEAIVHSGFVGSYHAVSEISNWLGTLRALSDPDADEAFADYLPFVHWVDGYNGVGFMEDSDPVCVIPYSYFSDLQIAAMRHVEQEGMDLPDVMENLWVEFPIRGNTKVSFRAVGVYGESDLVTKDIFYTSILSLKSQYDALGKTFFYNGLEMQLTNLENLEAFKDEMVELGMDRGSAVLVINDILLRQTSSQLKRQIRLMESVLPILLILVAGIGFGLSFLLLRGRRREAAVMRSLGMKRGSVFGTLLLESGMQAVLGGLLGAGLTVLILGKTAFQPVYFAQLLGFYLLGGAAAVWKISGANVFTTMRE